MSAAVTEKQFPIQKRLLLKWVLVIVILFSIFILFTFKPNGREFTFESLILYISSLVNMLGILWIFILSGALFPLLNFFRLLGRKKGFGFEAEDKELLIGPFFGISPNNQIIPFQEMKNISVVQGPIVICILAGIYLIATSY